MKSVPTILCRPCATLALVLALSCPALPVVANEGAAAPEPIKLTVNLGDPARDGRYLQVEMVLEGAAEVLHAVTAHKPKVLHELILILSSQESGRLLTLEGKHALAEAIVSGINKVLHESPKTGVQDVLFTNFIIQ